MLPAKLATTLKAECQATNRGRRLTDEALTAAVTSRLFDLALPKEWGGLETLPSEFIDISREIAGACPSAAWVVAVTYAHSWLVCNYFSRDITSRIFKRSENLPLSGVLANKGRFIRDKETAVVSGDWAYASAIVHSQWVLLGAQGPASPHSIFLAPVSSISIDDNWRGPGLLGTASHSVHVKDLCVGVELSVNLPANPNRSEPLYTLPMGLILNWALVGVGLGLADQLGIDMAQETSAIKTDCLAIEASKLNDSAAIARVKGNMSRAIQKAVKSAQEMRGNTTSQQSVMDLITLGTHIAFRN